ncbi:hypothetical protein THRCLA_06456 [Thraustotheca clavata]|uniref:Adenine DNA glycosylase n=1 Tax=Thraustotheca clavata TaxID=74557 RepID=A0A1V9ZNM1_9STRA|nr:hypothetical protein THRCLA_06456 [Thraustotheca clavata]
MTHSHRWTTTEVQSIKARLLQWYDKERRCLPWRGDAPPFLVSISERVTSDRSIVSPYATWVSEIMCQQTRVETVVEYYVKWMEKFPTVEALAAADPEQVNAAWAGLGYYRRARMLHEGAKFVVEKLNGKMPQDVETLKTIPGIGPYTAGAIASVAFNVPAPLVDGNVIRVVARLRAIGADPKHKPLLDHCWESGETLIDKNQPGDFNQAIMELGATLCSIQNPSCMTCPVQDYCHAYAESQLPLNKGERPKVDCTMCDLTRLEEWGLAGGEVTQYPLKTRKKAPRNETLNVLVLTKINSDGQMAHLMTKRPEGGLLAGQWEFPVAKISDDGEIPNYSKRKEYSDVQLLSLFDLTSMKAIESYLKSRQDKGELIHIFSHVKHHMGIEHIQLDESSKLDSIFPTTYSWLTQEDLTKSGLTTGMKKVLGLLNPSKRAKQTSRSSRNVKCKTESTPTIKSFFEFASKSQLKQDK